MDNKMLASLSIEDSESSYQESESIDAQINSLQISSSWDSCKDNNENIARGKPVLVKSHSEKTKSTRQTSELVLRVIDKHVNSNKSSGYSSSISPGCENNNLNYTTFYDNQVNFVNKAPIFSENIAIEVLAKQQARIKLREFFSKKIAGKNGKKGNLDQWIFDFGDTNLIKCCRRGYIPAVIEALKEIKKHNKFDLVNRENAAKETSLSIATYQMNEILINLLLENGANPYQPLSMRNNVLHIAADLENDKERKTFGYLINGIRKHQDHNLIRTLRSKNIFNYDPLQILQLHSNMNSDDPISRINIDQQINETSMLINSYFRGNPYMPQNY